ncbi:hypothetical protein [Halalkalibacter alkaliphilus]|uniref:Uncharacterized protein n=1 Tax=Halalkalibacter alkaliphilus TaxID=2917993 RepID=A0A9X2CVG7_9BACI|nr:hypothetical protein [Halalkalibacter alkaliphilus]MCL7748742.1 hypothetical protein [Halalkalibacter alkaliphilus]
MGTFTAQMLIGQGHTYDGGIINVNHTLYLSENSIPLLSLHHFSASERNTSQQEERIIWIPTLEGMLEDALLMVGLYVLKDEQLLELANRYFNKPKGRKAISLYDDVKAVDLQEIYECCRTIDHGQKIILSVFEGSTILNQLDVLERYPFDVEVCVTTFRRELNAWSGRKEVKGKLNV